jgi:hypothetical protein
MALEQSRLALGMPRQPALLRCALILQLIAQS